jgi:hypothetical protein
LVTGCGDAEDVTSSDEVEMPSGSPIPEADVSAAAASQRERAEALATCLTDKSIEANVDDLPDGQSKVYFTPPEGPYAWVEPDGRGNRASDDESTQMAEAAEAEGRTLLWIGGADRTEDYLQCIDESGYTAPVTFVNPEDERRLKQAQVDLDNDYAACARANGFPEVADVPAPVLDGQQPQAPPLKLPWQITEDGLRDLLVACPPYDEDRVRELANGEQYEWQSLTMGPWISFDVPAMDAPEGASEEDWDRFVALNDIVSQAQEKHMDAIIAQLDAEGIAWNGPRHD